MLSSINNSQERSIATDRKATLPLLQTNSMPVFSRYGTNQSKISEKARQSSYKMNKLAQSFRSTQAKFALDKTSEAFKSFKSKATERETPMSMISSPCDVREIMDPKLTSESRNG